MSFNGMVWLVERSTSLKVFFRVYQPRKCFLDAAKTADPVAFVVDEAALAETLASISMLPTIQECDKDRLLDSSLLHPLYSLPRNESDSVDAKLVLGMDAEPLAVSLILCLLSIFFIFGFCGNLTVIVRIIRTQQQFKRAFGKGQGHRFIIQRYVLLLACVDLLVTILIPMLFPFFYHGQWLIGSFMCQIFWTVENVNKILSIFILTAMAIERFLIVRYAVETRRKGKVSRTVFFVFVICSIIVFLLLSPLFRYVQLDISCFRNTLNDQLLSVTTCVSPMPDTVFLTFTIYMFVLCYCLPAVIITFCYGSLIHLLKKRCQKKAQVEKNGGRNHVVQKVSQKVSKSIMLVTAFHFACWTPFWLDSILHLSAILQYQNFFIFVQMCTLILPYANCSFNWCFYVLLNRRLRKQIFRRSSTHISTNH